MTLCHTGRPRSMISAAPSGSSSSPTARPSSRGRLCWAAREASMNRDCRLHRARDAASVICVPIDSEISRNRRIAVAIEHPQHLALGIGARMRRSDHRSLTRYWRVCQSACGAFDRDNALPHRRQHLAGEKSCAMRPASPTRSRPERAMINASAGPTRRRLAAAASAPLIKLAHAGVGGAAEMDDLDLRKQPPHIGARGARSWCRS